MIYLNDLQKDTLLLVDSMIQENKTHKEIMEYLSNNGYTFRVEIKNGYMNKTKTEICKIGNLGNMEYTFVDLIKRRNGLAYWETIKIS